MTSATNVVQVFQMYNGDTWLFALFLAAAAYLLFRRGSAYRFHAVLTVLAACLFLFNQAAFWLLGKILGGTESYYRFLWMIPVVPMLSYVAVDLAVTRKKRWQRILTALAVFLAVALAGTPYLGAESLQRPSEVQYLNVDVSEVCRLINEDRQGAYPELEAVKVAAPIDLVMSLRVEEPAFQSAIVRSVYLYKGKLKSKLYGRQQLLLNIVKGKKITAKKIRTVLKKAKVQYVVIPKKYKRGKWMKKAGCTVVAKTYHYTIYRAK